MSKDTARHENGHGKYWTQMLNMAEDDLGPFEYRLLAHYERWASEGPKPEGVRTTARLCQMSPGRVLQARATLEQEGYITYIPPTNEQAAQGIGGVVIVLDRMEENVKRYSKNKPASKTIQGDTGEPVSKTAHPPVSKTKHSEELTTEEHKNISASQDDAGSAAKETDLPRTDKPKRVSKPDPWYDNILAVWGLREGGNGDMRKYLQGSATKKGWKEYNLPPDYTLTDAIQICHFARWYHTTKQGGKPGLSMVAERGKLQSAIMEWVDAGRPTGEPMQYHSERLFT